MKKWLKIGFIGQGWVGKNYADDFEERGYVVVRYALEKPYNKNKSKIKKCDIVFIAVPTPTTQKGFDYSIVENVMPLVGKGKIAVIKSTVLPGITEKIQEKYKGVIVCHSPEFLTEATAVHDARHPDRNIVGLPINDKKHKEAAEKVLSVLPKSGYELICSSREAELIKYGGNCWFFVKVVFMNMLYDLSREQDTNYNVIKDGLAMDPRIGRTHLDPIHKSGRGAGGHCFIKDFKVFREIYAENVGDRLGTEALKAFEEKNIQLLMSSNKDLDLLKGVYGSEILKKK